MSEHERVLAEVRDSDRRVVVLLERIWAGKIAVDHPELAGHQEDVLATVSDLDHVEPDARAHRRRYYRHRIGPSRWLLVVVSYEQTPGRIVTALATRKGSKAMATVNVKIGPLAFDHANYDADGDVLYLHVGAPTEAEGEETPEGHVLRFDPGTQRIVGLTVMNARWLLERDGFLRVTVPELVKASADELAPALSAV